MLERFQTMLERLKKQQKAGMQEMNLEFVQGLFDMQDMNKWLKYNAMNEEQLRNAQKLEDSIQRLLKRLWVPNFQQQNT